MNNVLSMAAYRRRTSNVVQLDTSRNRPDYGSMGTRELRQLAQQAGTIDGWQRMNAARLREALEQQ